MPITTVFFDLDGTLLPMEQEVFAKAYFGGLAKAAAPYGYEPKALISAIATGTRAMVKNPGEKTNEEVFWDTFAGIYGEEARKDIRIFDEFYQRDFEKVRASCGFTPKAREVISLVKERALERCLPPIPSFPEWPPKAASAGQALPRRIFFCSPPTKTQGTQSLTSTITGTFLQSLALPRRNA